MTTSQAVFTTATGAESTFSAMTEALREELGLHEGFSSLEAEEYSMEYCFVCGRATDHRGEHDALVEQGLAAYSRTEGVVYRLTLKGEIA
jgi:hypothetical protein